MNKIYVKLVFGLLLTINYAFATNSPAATPPMSGEVYGVFAQRGTSFNSWFEKVLYSSSGSVVTRRCDPLSYAITLADAYNDGQGTYNGVLCSNPRGYDNYLNVVTYQLNTYPSEPLTLNWSLYDSSGLLTSGSVNVSSSSGYFTIPGYTAGSGYSVNMVLTGAAPCYSESDPYELIVEYVNCN